MSPPKVPWTVPSDRRASSLEVGVFLLLILPSMVLSCFVTTDDGLPFRTEAIATIVRDVALTSLVAYFVWRSGERLLALGWTCKHLGLEASLGGVLFVPTFFLVNVFQSALEAAGLPGPPSQLPSFVTPEGPGKLALAVMLITVVAVAEETVFRGYLMLRFGSVTRSRVAALFLSAFLFSLGHGYEGASGVVTVGVLGLTFGVVFLWRGSLVAPMVMHFLQDFVSIVVANLVRGS